MSNFDVDRAASILVSSQQVVVYPYEAYYELDSKAWVCDQTREGPIADQ